MAGKIPRSFVDELLNRVNIVDIIDSRVPLSASGSGEYKARCPFHEEKTPSFTVSQNKQFYYCFGCEAHGSAIGFLMDHAHMDFPEAVESLAAQVGLQMPREAGGAATQTPAGANLLELLEKAARWFQQQLRTDAGAAAVAYIKERGVDDNTAAAFGLGYAPDSWDQLLKALASSDSQRRRLVEAGLVADKDGRLYDRFRKRLMFPLQDDRGRIVGFGGRIIGDGEPKYLNSPETALFHKGRGLYGLYKARGAVKKENHCLVVEGYMDVISLVQHGIENVAATLGTATTAAQIERLFVRTNHLLFCFDGDSAGQQAAWKALQVCLPLATDGRQVSFLFLPEGHDPDTLVREHGADELRRLAQEAQPLPEYLLRKLCEEVDLERLDGPGRLVKLAQPLVGSMPAGMLRQLVSTRLASLAQLPAATIAHNLDLKPDRSRPAPGGGGGGRRPLSLVARTISMLLQRPALIAEVPEDADWRRLNMPGVPLLAELIGTVRAHPQLNTAALVERYRDTPHFERLEILAAREHLLPEQMDTEFRSLIDSLLHKWSLRREIEALLHKNRNDGLDGDEKELLNTLLKKEKGLAHSK